jgi:hypothetical protein
MNSANLKTKYYDNDLVYTAQHRIQLRNQANEFIGLYEIEFAKFNI